ncbi:MAG: Arm DNA-binding domain-containing protein [Novosphingobium sp.]|nr:Arm DNA-binding domain-containing protein [Novosphingobium sp.]
MPLSETSIRKLKPRDKPYKVADEKGLYLSVTPSGGRLWNMKFRNQVGIEKKLSLGSYPELSLREARDRRDEARKQLANGIDPAEQKQRDKIAAKISAGNTFTAVAEAYIAKNERDGLAANTIKKRRWFVRLLQRAIGNRPIADLTPFDVLSAVRPFEAARNDEKAHRALQFVGSVCRFAVASRGCGCACCCLGDPASRTARGRLLGDRCLQGGAKLWSADNNRRSGEVGRAADRAGQSSARRR